MCIKPFILVLYFTGVFQLQVSYAQENLDLNVEHSINLLPLPMIQVQSAANAKGLRDIVTSFLINKGIQGIERIIDNRKKKYIAEYQFAVNDESFYNLISALGPFDPTSIRFKGFSIARIFKNKYGSFDNAFIARFGIDLGNNKINEIINNGIFHLRLESFELRSAKVKLRSKERKLNMDFEITFISSFINNNGDINTDVPVGKFLCSVRNAPVDSKEANYTAYYRAIETDKPLCSGQSFLVPRSAGYYKSASSGNLEKCFGYGVYSIKVNVRESSRNAFVDKVVVNNKEDILHVGEQIIRKKFIDF